MQDRRVITTADDFGVSVAVNEAVERAAKVGVLTGASLMVGGSACADAVERAKRLPQLRVGLHVVVVEGHPVLSRSQIPDLVDKDGRLDGRLVRAGVRFFFSTRVARQLDAEIRAQFAAYAATGLALDHVNAHKHMHLHPTVLGMIIRIGREYGMRAVRLPREPLSVGPLSMQERISQTAALMVMGPWSWLMRWRLRRAQLRFNDWIFGLTKTGVMNEQAILSVLKVLPAGTSEIYFHPTMGSVVPGALGSECLAGDATELAALLGARVRVALSGSDIHRISFSDID